MYLEPVIRSKVSQKEKNKYRLLMHRKMVLMKVFAEKEWRCRCRERINEHSGGRRGWDDWRKQHWDIHTAMCEIGSECMHAQLLQSCLTLCNPMNCSPPGSCVHEIFQARILEWVAISFCRRSSQPRDQTRISCIGRQMPYLWATREARI